MKQNSIIYMIDLQDIHSEFRKGKVLLAKGTRGRNRHGFELYISDRKFFAIISNSVNRSLWDRCEIDPKKFTVLENGVDARLRELGW